MIFFATQSDVFCLIPTIGLGPAGCDCCEGMGWSIFLSFAGFEIGVAFPGKPQPPLP